MMWYTIFKFEIQYRIKRADTYIFFLFLFLFSIVGVDFIFQGVEIGAIKKNSPFVIAKTMAAITAIFMVLASMIMGVSVLRDFQHQIESLMFINPIKKRDYLLGRFLGSFVVLLFVFSGLFLGMIVGEFMPWQDAEAYLSFNPFTYLYTFITITIPTLFFGACLFFVSGALTKKLVVVYTQGVFIFVIFLLTKSIENQFWKGIFDPFSLTTLTTVTESWSIVEKSTQIIPFSSALAYSKLFWFVLSVLILFFGYKKFNFSVVSNKRFKGKGQKNINLEAKNTTKIEIPKVKIQEGFFFKLSQLKQFSWFYFINICKQPSFLAIVICGAFIILINSVSLGTVYDVDSYPITYFIVEELQETSIFFFIIIILFYSGELVWRERTAKLSLIYDATAMSSFVNLLSKYVALILICIVLMLSLIISGIIFQTVSGYYNYEFQVYFYGFFIEILPFLALYALVTFFIQSLVNNKFIGILFSLVFFIVSITLGALGFNHPLYNFGGNSLGIYSDMNGYGHFLKPYLLIKTYWLLFGIFLIIAASLFIVRGTETSFIKRVKASKNRMSKSLLKFTVFIIVSFTVLGSYIFYNTNVLNKYWTAAETTNFRVGYEKKLKKFEYLPQPKIVSVNLNVELYPSKRNYTAEGFYILKNTTNIPISEVHIQKLIEDNIVIDYLNFEGGATTNMQYSTYNYVIYKLKSPLQPGAVVKMNFKQSFTSTGFTGTNSNSNIVENGIFFNNENLPTLGYAKKYELQDKKERIAYQLPKRANKALINDANELLNSRTGGDSDGINFEMIIGTEIDQTAIAPGKILKQWKANNRNYFHYKVNEKMMNFYAIVSARYQVKKDIWMPKYETTKQPVELEIYHHKTHQYNLDRMMQAMKVSFDYYSANFSEYQYEQMRIMEFPRYAEFAQSFPGTVPFSEAIGFVLDIDDEKDVDMAFYVTAHELAHQWFGMQVAAANVKGQHLILETLSQYAALMVLKQKYSDKKVQQFLKIQQEKYSKGKQREIGQEPSLALVENQDYIYYAKGAIAMYKLQQSIGENNVNLALKQFLKDWNSINGSLKLSTNRYATSKDLLAYFRAVTPNDLQHVITELFESVEKISINEAK
ncbi:ABC transporter permease/M1 family aminopeptidase [Tenacibaculum ovolyticum]|uniref:ABC transporter permease/M1 family aminopeptidase n=1 Tax=Tenacibaculum ovolyticum TaxID=104270 RepID=UPI0003F6C889|nr:M1 family aminopeptidase [Tenacibaculum ovolyticum]